MADRRAGTQGPRLPHGPRDPRDAPDSVRERLLRHPLRRRIVDLLRERPGMNKSQIARELDAYASLLDHHLGELERAYLVVTRPSARDGEVLCFPPDQAHLWENERTRVLFGRAPNRAVALHLVEHGGRTVAEMADALGLARSTIRHHLRTLRDHGLVHQYQVGRTFVYVADEELEAWAGELGESYEKAWGP